MASEPREIGHFLIARGGPIYEMQQRLGLLSAKAFRAGRRALRALSRLKIETLLSSGAWATRHFRASERDMLGRNVSAASDAESLPAQDLADSSKLFATGQNLKTLPFSRAALGPLSAVTLLPLVAAGATHLPIKEITSVFKRLLL